MVGDPGFRIIEGGCGLARWAEAAREMALAALPELCARPGELRSGGTWCVGVDGLDNAPDGSVAGVALPEAVKRLTGWKGPWHRAQLSAVWPGYPRQDAEESDAAFRFRLRRCAAHLDGLLPVGPRRRRYLKEPHAFVLGLPLTSAEGAPLVVWPGSQRILGPALHRAVTDQPPTQVDLTDAYMAARAEVFDTRPMRSIRLVPGQAVLLHRHMLHGIAPWPRADGTDASCRIVAYFRPVLNNAADWLHADW